MMLEEWSLLELNLCNTSFMDVFSATILLLPRHTVDGRNPAPPGIVKTL